MFKLQLRRVLRPMVLSCIAAALVASACGGGGSSTDETPAAIRTASSQIASLLLSPADVGSGWKAQSGTPTASGNSTGPETIRAQAYKAWSDCIGNTLSGGFIALGRLAYRASPIFEDSSQRTVSAYSAVLTTEDRAKEVFAAVGESEKDCASSRGQVLNAATAPIPNLAAEAPVSFRLTLTLKAADAPPLLFDLVAYRHGKVIIALVFNSFGDDTAPLSAIAQRTDARIAQAVGP